MGLLDLIKQPFISNRLKQQQKEQLEFMLNRIVGDLQITDEEITEINQFIENCELDSKELGSAFNDALMQVIKMTMADKRISTEELNGIKHICERLGFPDDFYQYILDEFGIYHLLDEVGKGVLPIFQTNNLILQNSETVHFDLPAFLMEEKVISKQFVGKSQGVSIRVMKGVTYRVGASRGELLTKTGFVNVSNGNLIITNKRLVFSGYKKSFNTSLEKILDIRLFSDALQISVTNKQKPIIFGLNKTEAVELAGATISALLNVN